MGFNFYNEYLTYYIDQPSDRDFIIWTKDEYYTIEWGKDTSDAKNWVTNHINIINALYLNSYGVWYNENKLYLEIPSYYNYIKYSIVINGNYGLTTRFIIMVMVLYIQQRMV